MIRSRFSLLGVLVAAMGLMAFFASAAHAEGEWLVLQAGVLLTGAQIEAAAEKFEVVSLENSTLSLLSEIGTTKIDMLCTNLSFGDALLNATGGVKNGATMKFTGCKFLSGGTNGLEKEQPKCQPKTNGGPLGTVETLAAHATLKLHELTGGVKDDTLLILPDNVEVRFTTFELGASCAFGEEEPIFGHIALQDCGGTTKALEHLASHLLTEFAPLTTLALFAQRGKAGAKNASIDGSTTVKLASGRLFAGSPK
jgi:hypothetical protein